MVECPVGTASIPPSIESQLSISFSIPAVIWLRSSAVDAPSSESISSSKLKSLSCESMEAHLISLLMSLALVTRSSMEPHTERVERGSAMESRESSRGRLPR